MSLRFIPLAALLVACGGANAAAPTSEPANVVVDDDPPDRGPCPDPQACVDEAEQLRVPASTAPDATQARADNARALELYTAACERDHPRGCEGEAETLQDHGYYGVPEDDRRAAVAWDRACNLGNTHACYRYGFYLWEGIMGAVVVDGAVEPYHWNTHRELGLPLLQRGCDGGEARACELLAELRASGQLP